MFLFRSVIIPVLAILIKTTTRVYISTSAVFYCASIQSIVVLGIIIIYGSLGVFALLLLESHLRQFFRKLLVGEIGNIGVEVEVFGFDFGLILPTEIVLEVEN